MGVLWKALRKYHNSLQHTQVQMNSIFLIKTLIHSCKAFRKPRNAFRVSSVQKSDHKAWNFSKAQLSLIDPYEKNYTFVTQ